LIPGSKENYKGERVVKKVENDKKEKIVKAPGYF
jgi:hypothetical protein